MPPGDKYLAFLEGAGGSYAGLANSGERAATSSRVSPDPEWTADVVRGLTLAFWDAYLKGDAQAKQVLSTVQSTERLEFAHK
jgi:hypothetical protein